MRATTTTLLLLLLAAAPARAAATRAATCLDVDRLAERWSDLQELIEEKADRHGAKRLPKADAAQIARTKLKLLPGTLAVVKTLEASAEQRWRKVAAYLFGDLKLLSEIDHADADDWEDEGEAISRLVGQLQRVSKLCDLDVAHRLGGRLRP